MRYTLRVMVRFVTLSRLVAFALLLCIGQDITADLSCDQSAAAPVNAEIASTQKDGDECQTVCVPDCFCCCIGAESDRPGVMKDLGRIANPTEEAPEPPLDGVSVSIFHPPLLRA